MPLYHFTGAERDQVTIMSVAYFEVMHWHPFWVTGFNPYPVGKNP